jgi:hypothetical protein
MIGMLIAILLITATLLMCCYHLLIHCYYLLITIICCIDWNVDWNVAAEQAGELVPSSEDLKSAFAAAMAEKEAAAPEGNVTAGEQADALLKDS